MTVQYGVYRGVFGDSLGVPQFVAVTDGQTVEFINTPASIFDYANPDNDTKSIFQVRIDRFLAQVPDNDDAAEMLERLNYNQPFSLQISETYGSMDDARAAAQQAAQETEQEQA